MKKVLISFIVIFCSTILNAQTMTSYFNAGNPIEVDGKEFYLGWSSNPQEGYYLQEYFPKGEAPEHYNDMFTVSLFEGNVTPEIAAQAKANELATRKESDKICNYRVLNKDGEYIVDFVVSDMSSGQLTTVEWDLHYYKSVKIGDKNYLLLMFLSQRAYGDDIIPLLKHIPDNIDRRINALTKKKLKIEIF